MEVSRSERVITVCQRKYCLDLLKDYGMTNAKSISTPMDYTTHISKHSRTPLAATLEYRRLIGRLLYLTNSRLEICFAVAKLCQFLDCATDKHFEAGLRILKYLKGAPDSDWSSCLDSRRSISGYCFFLGSSIISWKSKKQNTVAASSCEAEYRALASATREAQWLTYMLKELHINQERAVMVYCDSQSALHIAANPVFHEMTKHIEVDCHIARDKWQEGVTKLMPIASVHQTTDILTKALSPNPFRSCHSKLGLIDLDNPSLRRGIT
ncbi:hypothetical protein PIB30_117723 [Stylosanthes scabra]|uniref:Retrovirus-related Pol polyprotein from transposon TNT 1-94 n=1 Tax=Stylosanthes scabra TaxID=79078 RepID=A0ABU6XDV7_9FABA|nr:hypothetical protein [Stylosanthes scabra]